MRVEELELIQVDLLSIGVLHLGLRGRPLLCLFSQDVRNPPASRLACAGDFSGDVVRPAESAVGHDEQDAQILGLVCAGLFGNRTIADVSSSQ